MFLATVIIVSQILFSTLIFAISSSTSIPQGKVLSEFAQAGVTDQPATPSDQSLSNQTTPDQSPTENSSSDQTPADTVESPSPADLSSPVDQSSNNSTGQTTVSDQSPSPAASDAGISQEQASPSEIIVPSELPSPDQTAVQTPLVQSPFETPTGDLSSSPSPFVDLSNGSVESTTAILNPDQITANPENISSSAIDQARKEDAQVAQALTPQNQTQTLINNALTQSMQISNSVANSNYSDVNYVSRRLNDTLDQAISKITQLPAGQASQAKKQLQDSCNAAEPVLRNVQLSVPEELVQDLEINRAKCFSINQ